MWTKVIDLVKADGNVRGLGYNLVCNRSQSNLGASTSERNQNESDFFSAGLWSSVPKDRVGIAALKRRLNALLVGVTRNTFVDVMLDLENRIRNVHIKQVMAQSHQWISCFTVSGQSTVS